MAANVSGNSGFIRSGALLVTFLVLAIVIVGSDRTTSLQAGKTNPHALVAGVLDAEYSAPPTESITPTSVNTPSPDTTEITAPTCTLERDAQERKICKRQAQETKSPYVLSKLVSVKDSKPFCKYDCTLECPVGQEQLIYEVLDIAGNSKKFVRECADSGENPNENPTTVTEGIRPGESLAACKARGACFDVADFSGKLPAKSGKDSALTDATNVVFGPGKTSKAAPELGAKVTANKVSGKAAPIRNAQTTISGNQPGAIAQNAPSTQSLDVSNPVTGASGTGAVQRSGAGIAQTNNSYQPQTNPYQSLQRPEIFQPTQNAALSTITGDRQSPRQPNFVERFARFFGAEQGLFNRQTPKGNTTNQTAQQPTPVVIIGKPADAHIRSIQAIAYDVAKQQTLPTDTRIESFEKTLTVVGGVHTSGRATTTINREYGRILDLITEDRAIKALEVAEQTGLRVRNRVFCIKEEKSEGCLLRRNTAAKRVERQTFITELEKSNGISQADLEHFLAVYDGWVSPESPRPKAQPISLINAPNKIDVVDEAATTTPGIIARTVTGIGKGVQKILDALSSWLMP